MRTIYPKTGRAAVVGFTGPPGVGKSTLHGGADQARARARALGRGALHRPVLAVHQGRAARRPDPPHRPFPGPGRVHPLDGQPRRARRPERGGAAGGAAHGRVRAATWCCWRRWASARPRSTSSTTPTPSCWCSCPAPATRSRHSRPGSWRSPTSSSSTRPTTRSPTRWSVRSRGCWRSAPSPTGPSRSSAPRRSAARGWPRWPTSSPSTARTSSPQGTLSERRRRNLLNEVLAIATYRMRRELEESVARGRGGARAAGPRGLARAGPGQRRGHDPRAREGEGPGR